MQYFAQDEATRLDPAPTVYETLASGSPMHMVPMIRNILGGFLFSGDDVYKHVRVLSGGERTRLAVARMLLRPSNTLLLDEPTNHLDLDSKEVLLDALVDYGGTLIFVSHDRYFVERLATKIIEVGDGTAVVYPGTYNEFLWHKEHPAGGRCRTRGRAAGRDGQVQARMRQKDTRGSPPRAKRAGREAARTPAHFAGRNSGHAEEKKTRRRRSAQAAARAVQARQAADRIARNADRRDRSGDPRVEQAMAAPVSTRTGPRPSRSSTAIRP